MQLSGSPSAGNGSFLRITSQADGAEQVLNSSALARWGNTSAYFNGEAVLIELFARAGTGANSLLLQEVVAGIQSELEGPLNICGPTDDRVPSTDPRAARILPAGCTGFLFNQRPNCLLTAGHCGAVFSPSEVVEFNVPDSNPNGTIRNPPPKDQYPVEQASIQFQNFGLGNDWCQFGVSNNTTTGLSPLNAQGASYNLAGFVPTDYGSTLRITGYGLDYSPPEHNQTLQTAAGQYLGKDGTILKYFVDTAVYNSGSAVEHVPKGLVYGIHTHGYCLSEGVNKGTAITQVFLQHAIACPLVLNVCTDCNGNGILDRCDLNCASSCEGGCNVPGCGGSSDCNSNGVPDECEPDCNENGVPDECEEDEAACCLPGGSCVVTTACSCALAGGTFLSEEEGETLVYEETFCDTTQRACCRPPPYEDCVVTSGPCCDAVGGTFWENTLTCASANCPSYDRPPPDP